MSLRLHRAVYGACYGAVRAFVLGAGLAFGPVGAAGAGAALVGCSIPGNVQDMRAQAGAAMNDMRRAEARAPLIRDARLDTAAQDHACWMSETGAFSHEGAQGSSFSQRAEAAGYPLRRGVENIALGQSGGRAVVASWMASPAHRDNMLMREAGAYGVGLALLEGRPVWVMLFAGR